MKVTTHIPFLDEVLSPWQQTLGADYLAYKNHVIRMLNFCFYLAKPDDVEEKKLIIAAAFHDIGIWTNNTVDYLAPSITHLEHYLHKNNLSAWFAELSVMIAQHHKITKTKYPQYPLVEIFRQADLVDFSLGMVKNAITKNFIREVKTALPNAGFHRLLLVLTWQRIKQKPFSPLPMMKW
jgi:HD domain-containing protein